MCNPNGFELVGDAVNPYGDYNKAMRARLAASNQAVRDRNKDKVLARAGEKTQTQILQEKRAGSNESTGHWVRPMHRHQF